jgi:hypothetical protein
MAARSFVGRRRRTGRHGELTKHKFLCQNKLTLLLMKPKAGGVSQSTHGASNFKELYSKDNSISPVPSLYFSLSVFWQDWGKGRGRLLLEKETLKQFPLLGCERCTLYSCFTQEGIISTVLTLSEFYLLVCMCVCTYVCMSMEWVRIDPAPALRHYSGIRV